MSVVVRGRVVESSLSYVTVQLIDLELQGRVKEPVLVYVPVDHIQSVML